MSGRKLTRKEALELITPMVDDEVDEDTRIAFLAFIQQDQAIRAKYESARKIKNVISKRCPCARAPERLKKRVHYFLENQRVENRHSQPSEPIYDMPTKHSMSKEKKPPLPTQKKNTWKYAIASSILFAAIFFGLGFYIMSSGNTYNVEEYAYNHFTEHDGKMIEPTISTASIANAELELANTFDMPVTVPPLRNADFKGVVFSDFVPGFKTPLMEYYLPAEDQYIYIFAFKINDLNQFESLSRSPEAISSCIKSKDFHIRNINGKHVVSWKWDNTWYAAISNHDGKTLASLVEPLGFEDN